MIWIQLPCKDGVLCQHAICGNRGAVESRRRVLLRDGGLPAGGTVGVWPRWQGSCVKLQVQVQVRCSVMPDLDGTRLNALCLVGWSLETRAEKERGAVNWGRQDVRSDDDRDEAPRCECLARLGKEGGWRGVCCRAGRRWWCTASHG